MKLFFLLSLLSSTISLTAQQESMDWPNLAQFAGENEKLAPPSAGEKRVVFMGN
jgi:hypothetical protein